ncbi:hypothetical protein MHYP_G00071310 [Metynnis hypsauchen]
MMAFVMANELACQYNFVGRHGKRYFQGLRLFEVFYGALKRNTLTQNINQKDAEKAVSKWYSGARDHGGNRAIREQRYVQHRNSEKTSDNPSKRSHGQHVQLPRPFYVENFVCGLNPGGFSTFNDC